MKATLDIPDDVMESAARAAERNGVSLKDFIVQSLEKNVISPTHDVNKDALKPWELLLGTGTTDIRPEDSPWDYNGLPSDDPIWRASGK